MAMSQAELEQVKKQKQSIAKMNMGKGYKMGYKKGKKTGAWIGATCGVLATLVIGAGVGSAVWFLYVDKNYNIEVKDKKELSTILTEKELGEIRFSDAKEITGGMIVEAIKKANEKTGITENDLNVSDISINLETNIGTAKAKGVGSYKGEIQVSFTIDPNDPNRPTETIQYDFSQITLFE